MSRACNGQRDRRRKSHVIGLKVCAYVISTSSLRSDGNVIVSMNPRGSDFPIVIFWIDWLTIGVFHKGSSQFVYNKTRCLTLFNAGGSVLMREETSVKLETPAQSMQIWCKFDRKKRHSNALVVDVGLQLLIWVGRSCKLNSCLLWSESEVPSGAGLFSDNLSRE